MNQSDDIEPPPDPADAGLDDHSEELSERSEADARIRFYRAMADTEVDFDRLMTKLARAVTEVIFDFCVVYLVDDDPESSSPSLTSPSAYHPHPEILQSLHRAFTAAAGGGVSDGLVERVVSRQESYFRPRWRPSLLQPYAADNQPAPVPDIGIHSLMVVPMVNTDGETLGALLVGRHTTTMSYDEADLALTEWIASHAAMKLETARLYRDLRQTNRELDAAVQARDDFISVASHQLRTPLSTLKLHAQMLRRTALDDPDELTPDEVIPKLESIDHQVEYLDRLVDQLVSVSKIIDGGLDVDWQDCDLARIVTGVARRLDHEARQAGCRLDVECAATLRGIWDRERLDHVLTNLISNAVKYGQANPVTIRAGRRGDQAVVEVVDRGIGIPVEARDQIFERFERAVDDDQSRGLGLGLWIVREYVESLEGDIEVESTVGDGSTFRVRLPLQPDGAPTGD